MLQRLFLVVPLLLLAALARAELPPDLETRGPDAVRSALEAPLSESERAFAEGLLAAMLNRSREAEGLLAGITDDATQCDAFRRRAAIALSGVRLRLGHFSGAAAALRLASSIAPLDASTVQSLQFAEALRDAPVMEQDHLAPGRVALTRDLAGLHRGAITVNGGAQDAVFDTGAAYSTITESSAARLGLKIYETEVSVGAAAVDAVASRVAIAETLELGGTRFRNVVFIVLPDAALSFADGQYTIEAILGFPVLSGLERLMFAFGQSGDELVFGPSEGGEAGNVYLAGLSPVVIAAMDEADRPLHLLLDTGAQATNLSREALSGNPSLASLTQTLPGEVGGAGGSVSDADAGVIPAVTFRLADIAIPLADIQVHSVGEAGKRDGILGQDILRSGGGFVLDFGAMSLDLLPAKNPDQE